MENLVKTQIPISELRQGMTVEYNGELLTVSGKCVTKGFMGYSFRGNASKREITRVQFAVPTAFGIHLE